MRPRIGISANFFHPDPQRDLYKGKTLIYGEESLFHWILSDGAIPYLIPRTLDPHQLKDILSDLDGIVFSGGADLAPGSYREIALHSNWEGDAARDEYEIALFNQALKFNKPILGLCRGIQLINVALGGTLYQDTATQKQNARIHRDPEVYDNLKHEIRIMPDTVLAQIFPAQSTAMVNSVHHQAIKELAHDLQIQAMSIPDDIIESVKLKRDDRFVFAVQWHPEWRRDPNMLDSLCILDHYLNAVRDRMVK